jgi:hypothetical protein
VRGVSDRLRGRCRVLAIRPSDRTLGSRGLVGGTVLTVTALTVTALTVAAVTGRALLLAAVSRLWRFGEVVVGHE